MKTHFTGSEFNELIKKGTLGKEYINKTALIKDGNKMWLVKLNITGYLPSEMQEIHDLSKHDYDIVIQW